VASYRDTVNDDYGRPIPGVLVYVFDKNGALATLGGGQANPITTDVLGTFSFNVDDGVYSLEYRFAGVTRRQDNVIIGEPPEFTGPPGPAGNVAATIDQLKAAPISNGTMIAAYDGSGSTMTWTLGDYRALNAARPQDYVQANGISLQTGAWVRQNARALVAQLNAPGAAIMSQADVNAERVSVLRFGADWTGERDSIDQIQACVDWLSDNGGGEAEITRGNYKMSRPISLPSNVGLVGQGPCSVLRPQSCNGINIQKSDGIGPRRVGNFWIYGNGGDAYCGVEANIAFPDRVTGLMFENLYVSFMGTAVKGRGFWHTSFRDITINQVYNGIVLYDRNVHVYMSAIRATKGGLVTGSGPSIGIQLGDSVSALRPEDVHIAHSITVGFDDGLYWRNVLAGSVIATTFDFCKRNGIHLVTADGNSSFRDVYIQADATDGILRAVYCEPLGTLPGAGTIVFDTVSTRAASVPSVPGELRSFGFDIANNQANITVKDCSSDGFQVDVRADGAQRSVVQNHRGTSQAIIFNSKYGALRNSFFPGGITLSGNLAIDFGENNGLHGTTIKALVDVPANATTVTVTFLSLNMPDLPLGGYTIIPTVADYGTVNHGGMTIAPTRTAVTVNFQNALAVSSTVAVTLRII